MTDLNAQIKILNDFNKALVSFLDELIDMFPNEPDFIVCRIMIKDRIPITTTMEFFVKKLLPEKDYIKIRDNEVFTVKNALFGSIGIDSDKTSYYKHFWNEKLDEDDRQAIWNWLDAFVFLCEKYQKSL